MNKPKAMALVAYDWTDELMNKPQFGGLVR